MCPGRLNSQPSVTGEHTDQRVEVNTEANFKKIKDFQTCTHKFKGR